MVVVAAMVDGLWPPANHHGNGDSDDDMPAAPPEEEDEVETEQPLSPTVFGSGRGTEPLLAPPEEEVAGLEGEAAGARHGVRVIEEVYSKSCEAGSNTAMDAVRALYPHWSEFNANTEMGRRVKWARCSNDWVYGELSTGSFASLIAGTGPIEARWGSPRVPALA